MKGGAEADRNYKCPIKDNAQSGKREVEICLNIASILALTCLSAALYFNIFSTVLSLSKTQRQSVRLFAITLNSFNEVVLVILFTFILNIFSPFLTITK